MAITHILLALAETICLEEPSVSGYLTGIAWLFDTNQGKDSSLL